MKFLYISESSHPNLGGASKCIYTLLSNLVDKGHTCYTIGPNNTENTFTINNITVIHTSNIYDKLESFLVKEKPDIVITQLHGADRLSKIVYSHNIPLILRIPSFEFVCINSSKMSTCDQICLQGKPCDTKGSYFPLFKKSIVTGCSDFVTNIVRSIYNIPCTTIYPFIDTKEHLVDTKGNCITMIQGTNQKGVNLFLDIAKQLPEYNYLIVGQLEVKTLPKNVVHIPPTENMKQVWEKTKVLVIPTLIQEAFGRVAVEAAINGIPVIASDKGGLPEAVCSPFCYPPNNIDKWISEIKNLMEDTVYYNIRSIQAKEYSEKFNIEDQVSRFLQLAYRSKYPDLPIVDNNLKISVLTSAYNSGEFLEKYFENMRSQIYTNFEIILTLNDPTPEEETIVEKYSKYFDITVLRVPLEPVTDTYNRIYPLAKGDVILVAAVDDLLREDTFGRYVYIFNNRKDIDIVYGDHIRVDKDGKFVATGPKSDFDFNTLKRLFYLGPHVVIRKRIIDNGELQDINFLRASDYEFYLRLAKKGYKFLRIPIELSTYVEHPDAITYLYREEQSETTKRIQELYQ
jgi:glycosyltransferase involved in cell wall biosynthesis